MYGSLRLASRLATLFDHLSQVCMQVLVLQTWQLTCIDLRVRLARALGKRLCKWDLSVCLVWIEARASPLSTSSNVHVYVVLQNVKNCNVEKVAQYLSLKKWKWQRNITGTQATFFAITRRTVRILQYRRISDAVIVYILPH